MKETKIEWCDSTWNCLRGCSRVSEGCRNCYAEKMAYRFSGVGQPYEGLAILKNDHASWTGKVVLAENHLLDPLKWKPICTTTGHLGGGRWEPMRPRRIFVNSMSDLFHENVPDGWIDKIFAVMALRPQHIFQVLTKRPERMLDYMQTRARMMARGAFIDSAIANALREVAVLSKAPFPGNAPLELLAAGWPLPNVWLGVSVENQAAADERIPLLLQTPATVRFGSCEPLLGPVNLEELPSVSGVGRYLSALSNAGVDPGAEIATKLDWVICGGESGPGARPMHPDWARLLRDQCKSADVAFFMKQMGSAYGPNKGHNLPPDLDIKQFPEAQ